MKPYTLLTKSDLRQIADQYSLVPFIEFKALSGGLENSNYLLKTKAGEYVLTICERKSQEESSRLAQLLLHLEHHGFSTTQIIRTKTGNSIGQFQSKPIFIKSFLEGEIHKELDDELIFQVGSLIARLHQIPAPNYLPTFFSYGQQTFQEILESEFAHPFERWLSGKHTYIRANLHPDLPKSLIHGDIFDNNVILLEILKHLPMRDLLQIASTSKMIW